MLIKPARGFTLVEAIFVIVITGIVAGVAAVFIRGPIKGYVDSAGRAEVSDEADLAVRRMARDLRLALPNSLRVVAPDNNGIEFLVTKGGGRYLSTDDGADTGLPLDFNNQANKTFSVIGSTPDLAQRIIARTDYMVVYNLGQGYDPANAYLYDPNSLTSRNIARIDSFTTAADGYVDTITLTNNPFAVESPSMPSPTQRFQVVGGPVMFLCQYESGSLTLRRYWNYPVSATQVAPPTSGESAIMATNLDTCDGLFNYDNNLPGLQRSGLVTISLALKARNTNDPAIRLMSQVHVDNTP